MAFNILIGFFFIIIGIGMILINKMTNGKMKLIEKIILGTCITTSISIGSLEVMSIIDEKTESLTNIYSGYVYLMEGYIEKADEYFNRELETNENTSLALYGKSKIYVFQGNYNESEKILKQALPKTKDKELKEVIGEDLLELKNLESKTEAEIKTQVNHNLNEVIESLKIKNKRKIDQIDKYVSVEQKLDMDEDIYVVENALNEMLEKDKNNIKAKKLLAKTYLQNNKYHEAYKEVKEVLTKDDDISNIILLTDIVAESRYNETNLLDKEDKEIKKYNKKLKQLDEDIDEIEKNNRLKTIIKKNDNDKKIEELRSKKEKIEKQKQDVIIKRTINYLNAMIDVNEKDEITKKLQIAKLYYVAGNNEKSKASISKVSKVIYKLSESDSYIAKAFSEYNDNIQAKRDEKSEPAIRDSVKKVIDVVNTELSDTVRNNSANSAWEDFLLAYAKYSSIPVVITNVDSEQYPEITVYSNIGGEKQGWFYLNKTFKKSDFKLEDTEEQITDFTVEKVKDSNTNIAIAIDKSPSMSGMAIREAKKASTQFVRNMGKDDRIGIIAFSQYVEVISALSTDKIRLEALINAIGENGGTSVYDGGMEAVRQIKDEEGKKIVILLTDGDDNSSNSSPEELIELAKEHGVIIYTIGLGEIQDSVLREIASGTGGQFYKAPSSVELFMIYEEIQNIINNSYKFKYSIKDSDKKNNRYSKITMVHDGSSDTKVYIANEFKQQDENSPVANDPQSKDENKYEFVSQDELMNTLMYQSLSTNSIIKASKNKEYSIIINGRGFDKGKLSIKVGKYKIANDKFEIVNSNKIKVYLPMDIKLGQYTIYGENQLGEKTSLKDALTIIKPGKAIEISLGNMTIKADSMTETEKGYRAFGNIVINNFIYVNKSIEIDTKGEHNPQHKYFSGKIIGNGKAYVKFNSGSDNFIIKHFKCSEYVMDRDEFEIEVHNSGSVFKNMNVKNVRIMTPVLQLQPQKIEILDKKIMVTALKFYLAGLDDESKIAVRNHNSFTKKVPLWISTSQFQVSIDPKGYHFETGEIWVEDTVTVVPKLVYLKRLILRADLPNGVISAKGTLMLGSVFGPKLGNEIGLKFNFETKDMQLDTIEMQIKKTIPVKPPFLYLESIGGGVSEIAHADSWLDSRLKLLASASSFKTGNLPIIGGIDIIEFYRLELNTRLSSKQFGFEGKARFLTSDIAELKVQFGADKKRSSDIEGFLLEGKVNIDYDLSMWKLNLNTLLNMKVNSNGYYSKATGDLYYKDIIWDLEGASITEITMTKDFIQYKMQVNNGKDDVDLLLRLEDGGDEPVWNIGARIKFEVNF